jgi:hypothetical protein
MPRYFFHFEGQQPHTDTTGEALTDDEAAWREAVRLSRDVEHALRPGDSWTQRIRGNRAGVRAGDGDAAVSLTRQPQDWQGVNARRRPSSADGSGRTSPRLAEFR